MAIFSPENSTIVKILAPTKENPRSSEGDFLRLKDGRIMFAYSYYHGEDALDNAACDIRCLYSDDDGETFYAGTADGLPKKLVSAADFGEKNIMSVSLCRMNNGDLGMFFLLKHYIDSDQFFKFNEEKEEATCVLTDSIIFARSADEGETFYQFKSILPKHSPGYYVLNNSRVKRLSDGRFVIPLAQHAYGINGGCGGNGSVWFLFSDDDGETWTRNAYRLDCPDASYTYMGMQEPGVIELPNGVLYAYARTDMGRHYESVSIDRGVHWFSPQPSRFTSPLSPLTIAQNPYTGKFYAVWTPVPDYNGRYKREDTVQRAPLAIAQSDDGYNFDLDNLQFLETDLHRTYCYTSIFFPNETTMLLSYSCNGLPGDGWLSRMAIRRIVLDS